MAATAATGPLVAHWFGEVTPLAPLGNLALVPLVELAVVPVGLAGATAGALWAPVGRWPLRLAGATARLALAIADVFRAHAPIWLCRSPNAVETACATGAGILALLAVSRRGRALWLAAVACALAAVGQPAGAGPCAGGTATRWSSPFWTWARGTRPSWRRPAVARC